MGLVVDSARLAAAATDTLDRVLPRDAYEVCLGADGRLEWLEGDARHTAEPGTGALRRLWIDFLSLLPIEWLL
jgi:putative cardiolipin synthase